ARAGRGPRVTRGAVHGLSHRHRVPLSNPGASPTVLPVEAAAEPHRLWTAAPRPVRRGASRNGPEDAMSPHPATAARRARIARAALLPAALVLALATPALAGPPWISIEYPANPLDPATRGALMVIR